MRLANPFLAAAVLTLLPGAKAAAAEEVGVIGMRQEDLRIGAYVDRGRATLTDMSGRVRERRSGRGLAYHAFETRDLEAGLYSLSLHAGSRTMVRRYFLGFRPD